MSPTDLAVSDLDGREQTDHDAIRARVRDAIRARVRDAVGQELLDEHRAELEAWAEQYFG